VLTDLARVTRVGDFSAIGRLFTYFEQFFYITEVQIFGLLFAAKIVFYFRPKNGLGNILGDFFTNLSGHPAID
jgi:hypothetical protein